MTCTCGHGLDAHEHYRPGLDCGRCTCRSYQKPRKPLRDRLTQAGRWIGARLFTTREPRWVPTTQADIADDYGR